MVSLHFEMLFLQSADYRVGISVICLMVSISYTCFMIFRICRAKYKSKIYKKKLAFFALKERDAICLIASLRFLFFVRNLCFCCFSQEYT